MDWYIKCLQNYAVFDGRARRKEYWMFVLFNFIVGFGIGFFQALLSTGELIGNIYQLAIIIPSLAVAVRRMHDLGKSGWFILIPIYNIILLATEGQVGTNTYGPDPKNGL